MFFFILILNDFRKRQHSTLLEKKVKRKDNTAKKINTRKRYKMSWIYRSNSRIGNNGQQSDKITTTITTISVMWSVKWCGSLLLSAALTGIVSVMSHLPAKWQSFSQWMALHIAAKLLLLLYTYSYFTFLLVVSCLLVVVSYLCSHLQLSTAAVACQLQWCVNCQPTIGSNSLTQAHSIIWCTYLYSPHNSRHPH